MIKKLIAAAMMVLLLTNHTSHANKLEHFTEDIIEYFGAEDPFVLFDPLVVSTPLSPGRTTSFTVLEYDMEEPDMGAEIHKVSHQIYIFSSDLSKMALFLSALELSDRPTGYRFYNMSWSWHASNEQQLNILESIPNNCDPAHAIWHCL